jgi:hypothetical protein
MPYKLDRAPGRKDDRDEDGGAVNRRRKIGFRKMPDLVVSILYVCGMPAAASKYTSKLPKSCDGLAPDEASGNA